ncbi:hypothetical protein ACWCY6_25505 [Streptomyces sp. 900105755]
MVPAGARPDRRGRRAVRCRPARGTLSGATVELHTEVGETVDLTPAGTGEATVRYELSQPAEAATTTSLTTGFASIG